MSADDVVMLVVAGAIVYVAYKYTGPKPPATSPAVSPSAPTTRISTANTTSARTTTPAQQPQPQIIYVQVPAAQTPVQQQPQVVYVQAPTQTTRTTRTTSAKAANNSDLVQAQAQAKAQAAEDDRVYNEYLAAAGLIGQIQKSEVPNGQGPSWLGCI